MKISPDEVAKVVKLARLRLDDDKLDAFAGQMGAILEYMETLGSVATEGVEPLYSPVDHATPLRQDVATKTCARSDILANAPRTDGQFFVVPKIV